ncbi:siderophore iron transporter mirC [Paracoccidioides lutzii Pb01]|uniref:Siderophore iron transporter mirC n=1 Tax=Paracoccidioides lutzii (strain ATCC MYA-826 / Pb01) TaxID=502779 RepID=C1GVF6_PARBA|nr:siderophore iron transporter mirC [Paracoccidioides lutzii Pb01]EEH40178.2 siderophore iron transporter mirC [Paracoccidioides lutzii Pb01]
MVRQTTSVRSYGTCESGPQMEDRGEDAGLLYIEPRATSTDCYDDENDSNANIDGRDPIRGSGYTSASSDSMQEGVRKIEAISKTWTKKSLMVAYTGIFLMAFSTSLEGQTVLSLSAYATSSFSKHSLISTVMVVQNVVNAVVKPPMAKVADVFGRFEAFCIAVSIYVLGYVQMAASSDVQTYASAQIFYSAGSTGLQILQQVFIADTSSLLNRALFSSLPDLPFLVTVWIGPMIAAAILRETSWRWGYGIWTIILPVAFLPLGLALFVNQRKAKQLNLLKPKPWKGRSFTSIVRKTWYDLDVFGLLLLSAGLALILIPITLAANAKNKWKNSSIISMVVVGGVCLLVFPLWESSKRVAPHPLLSLHLLKQRTALAGCALAFFYFMAFYSSVQPYLYSYLQVVQDQSVTTAGRVTQTFSFTSTIAAVSISFVIKATRRYRIFVTSGCCIYIFGLFLMFFCNKQGASVPSTFAIQTIIGLGAGFLNVPVQLGVQASAKHQEVAAATAMFLTCLEMGGAVGSAISGAVWTSSIPKKLALYLPEESRGDAEEIFGKLTKALSYPLGSATRVAINRAYDETFHRLLVIALCMAIPIIPLSLLMTNYRLDKMDTRPKVESIGDGEGEGLISRPSHDESPDRSSRFRRHFA